MLLLPTTAVVVLPGTFEWGRLTRQLHRTRKTHNTRYSHPDACAPRHTTHVITDTPSLRCTAPPSSGYKLHHTKKPAKGRHQHKMQPGPLALQSCWPGMATWTAASVAPAQHSLWRMWISSHAATPPDPQKAGQSPCAGVVHDNLDTSAFGIAVAGKSKERERPGLAHMPT